MITEAALGRVATKDDVEKVRRELREEIEKLRREVKEEIEKLSGRVDNLSDRVSRLEGGVSLLVRLFVAFNVPVLVGIMGILLRMALAPDVIGFRIRIFLNIA